MFKDKEYHDFIDFELNRSEKYINDCKQMIKNILPSNIKNITWDEEVKSFAPYIVKYVELLVLHSFIIEYNLKLLSEIDSSVNKKNRSNLRFLLLKKKTIDENFQYLQKVEHNIKRIYCKKDMYGEKEFAYTFVAELHLVYKQICEWLYFSKGIIKFNFEEISNAINVENYIGRNKVNMELNMLLMQGDIVKSIEENLRQIIYICFKKKILNGLDEKESLDYLKANLFIFDEKYDENKKYVWLLFSETKENKPKIIDDILIN